jgi:FKBP-type peptidyl-prolyl cis-trans isomerase
MWLATSRAAPKSTFDSDEPLMMAMCKTFKVNQERAQQVAEAENKQMQQFSQQMAQQSQQQLEANARQFQENQQTQQNIYQQQHDAQMEGYAQHNQQWQSDELQKQRNAADFIETIKGTRTVYDTQTGQSGTAELTSVTGVVNQLNADALDPNRFVQIPLRDEMYPIPPGGPGK